MHLTIAQAKALGLDVDALLAQAPAPSPAPAPPANPDPDDGMNKLERRFSWHLEALRSGGRIREWAFEPEKLRLAGRCWYTPDFRVERADGSILFCETKGGFAREDSLIKIKTAAVLHACYTFHLATHDRDAGWIGRPVTRTGFGPARPWEP